MGGMAVYVGPVRWQLSVTCEEVKPSALEMVAFLGTQVISGNTGWVWLPLSSKIPTYRNFGTSNLALFGILSLYH